MATHAHAEDVTLDLPLTWFVRQMTLPTEGTRLAQGWRLGFGPRFWGRHGSLAIHLDVEGAKVAGGYDGALGFDGEVAQRDPLFWDLRIGARAGFMHRNDDDPSRGGYRFEAGPRLFHPYFAVELDALVSSASMGTSVGWQISVTATRPRPVIAVAMALLSFAMVQASAGHDP